MNKKVTVIAAAVGAMIALGGCSQNAEYAPSDGMGYQSAPSSKMSCRQHCKKCKHHRCKHDRCKHSCRHTS